jgi:pimeloyl-ACP methyl ester carboxylesterase
MSIRPLVTFLTVASCSLPVVVSGQSSDLPVLLVHGFCSDSDTWSNMIARLQQSSPRYGNGVTKLYTAFGIVFHRGDGDKSAWDTRVPSRIDFSAPPYRDKKLFTIDFYSDRAGSFDRNLVNDTGIAHKSAELSAVIREVARINGSTKVIVVGHSLGGLAARSYVQSFASIDDTTFVSYVDNVAQIITIDTPHNGANSLASFNIGVSPIFSCMAESSRDKGDLVAHGEFLKTLNNENDTANNPSVPVALRRLYKPAIPDGVKTVAVYSWNDILTNAPADGDGVVPMESQRLTVRSPYNAQGYGYVTDYPHPIRDYYGPPPELAKLHIDIHERADTADLVRRLVGTLDVVTPPAITISPTANPAVFQVSGTSFTSHATGRLFMTSSGSMISSLIGSATADEEGRVFWTLTIKCPITPGTLTLRARDESTWPTADFNGDGIVNSIDFSVLNRGWFSSDAHADINRDGLVNSLDFSILNGVWFRTGSSNRVTADRTLPLSASSGCM